MGIGFSPYSRSGNNIICNSEKSSGSEPWISSNPLREIEAQGGPVGDQGEREKKDQQKGHRGPVQIHDGPFETSAGDEEVEADGGVL